MKKKEGNVQKENRRKKKTMDEIRKKKPWALLYITTIKKDFSKSK